MKTNRFIKETDLRKGFREILFIFIGITLAVWFNNWNDERKNRATERKALIELQKSIEHDLEDIRLNISSFRKRIDTYRQLIKFIEQEQSMTDTLKKRLPFMMGTTTFINNTAAYESLKSQGINLIRDQQLKLAILNYYDVSQDWIISNERDHHKHYVEYLKPMIIHHFSLKNRLTPYDAKTIVGNTQMAQVLRWARLTDSFILELYVAIETEAQELLQLIAAEIES